MMSSLHWLWNTAVQIKTWNKFARFYLLQKRACINVTFQVQRWHDFASPSTYTRIYKLPIIFQLTARVKRWERLISWHVSLELQACPRMEWEPRRRWRVAEASPTCSSSSNNILRPHGNSRSSIPNISSTATSSARRPPRWPAGAEWGHSRWDR